MTEAVATISDSFSAGESAVAQIGQSYKSYLFSGDAASPYTDYTKWFRVELTEPQTVVSC